MDTFFQLVAILASGIVIAMYGWSALSVRRWVGLVPIGLLTSLGGALVAAILNSFDLLSIQASVVFFILIPATSLLLGLGALMTNWTINSAEATEPEPSAPQRRARANGPGQTQEALIPDRMFGMSVMTMSSHLTLVLLLVTIFTIFGFW